MGMIGDGQIVMTPEAAKPREQLPPCDLSTRGAFAILRQLASSKSKIDKEEQPLKE